LQGPSENMNTKSQIGLAIAAAVVSLLFDLLALDNAWPTPGGYLIERMFHPGAVPGVKTDLRITFVVYAAVYVVTNFLGCLAILYVIYQLFRKVWHSRD